MAFVRSPRRCATSAAAAIPFPGDALMIPIRDGGPKTPTSLHAPQNKPRAPAKNDFGSAACCYLFSGQFAPPQELEPRRIIPLKRYHWRDDTPADSVRLLTVTVSAGMTLIV